MKKVYEENIFVNFFYLGWLKNGHEADGFELTKILYSFQSAVFFLEIKDKCVTAEELNCFGVC